MSYSNEGKASDFLKKSFALIDSPEKWIQNKFAQDKDGNEVNLTSPNAVCFCSLGAMRRIDKKQLSYLYTRAEKYLEDLTDGSAIFEYNDSITHEQLVQWWQTAIARAEKNGD